MTDNRTRAVHSLYQQKDYAKAWPLVSDILNETPDKPQALYLAGCIMRTQGHVGVALQLLRRALSFNQDNPNLWMHYGACLHDTHRYEEAREAFRRVRKMLPDDVMPIANMAATYVQEGRSQEALEWADKALALAPDNTIAGIAKGFGALGLGRWEEGWKYAQFLYGDKLPYRVYTEHDEPVWDGTPGQTVVVQADQGLGDMIMFSQCLPQMIADCKQVIVETNKRLAPTFARNFPDLAVYPTLKKAGGLKWPLKYEIDAHVHISLLGKFYRKRDEDFPRKPYLSAPEPWRAIWRKWLQQFPKPWVGLAWKGGIPITNTVARSMMLSDMAPIIEQGGTCISLAYHECSSEIARWNMDHSQQVILPDLDNDGPYDETLSLIAELDHVVTVTTTVAHACGAMGKRASVMVNRVPAWRYVYGGDGLLWYPADSLCLYRQKGGELDWSHVIRRVAGDYSAFVMPRFQEAA